MTDFVLVNNFFSFSGEVKRQKTGTANGTKFALPYACSFIEVVETEFLMSQYFSMAFL